MFKHELALEVGINPADGGQLVETTGVGDRQTPTMLYPVKILVPQIEQEFDVYVQFGLLPAGTTGLLGNAGFLAKFKTCFFGNDYFEIESL